MTRLPKNSLLRLDSASYADTRRWVLQRDGWRCQLCGSISGVEVHHTEYRSHGGSDGEENLITLCSECHNLVHRKSRVESPSRTDLDSSATFPSRQTASHDDYGRSRQQTPTAKLKFTLIRRQP